MNGYQNKLRIISKGGGSIFKSSSQFSGKIKHNRTENTFLPGSLKGAVRAEVGFPMPSKSGHSSLINKAQLPALKGARAYTEKMSQEYDFDSQKSQSQVSLAISQK